MAYAVELVSSAEIDLDGIYDYVQAAGSVAAQRWFGELSAAIRSLVARHFLPWSLPMVAWSAGFDCRQGPPAGAQGSSKLPPGVYGQGRGRYRIVYEVDAAHACVRILYLRHGARRWPEHEA